jgi:hypothetical protein
MPNRIPSPEYGVSRDNLHFSNEQIPKDIESVPDENYSDGDHSKEDRQ